MAKTSNTTNKSNDNKNTQKQKKDAEKKRKAKQDASIARWMKLGYDMAVEAAKNLVEDTQAAQQVDTTKHFASSINDTAYVESVKSEKSDSQAKINAKNIDDVKKENTKIFIEGFEKSSTDRSNINILQNDQGFPTIKDNLVISESGPTVKIKDKNGKVTHVYNAKDPFDPMAYNYEMNYSSQMMKLLNEAEASVNLPYEKVGDSHQSYFSLITKCYNRYKIANPNEYLDKAFCHVFFTRPDCNLLDTNGTLIENLQSNQLFLYAYKNSKELLEALSHNAKGYRDQFMMFLSNQAASFSLSDEYINKDTYGKTWKGDKIAYGKHDTESKAAGDFRITYTDDKKLHVYQLHKLWVDYISNVYTGVFNPKIEYQKNRIIDYASSVYYIMTDGTGENIIFWSKYYGVFPTTIPSTQYSWAKGNTLQSPDIEIDYQFSFKEDYNPLTLLEFNENACIGNISGGTIQYVPTFDPETGNSGTTYVGTPFIDVITRSDGRVDYKLRYMKRS